MLDDWQGGTGVLVLADGGHLWLLPGGGAEAGETRMEAVIREVREETGMRAYGAIALFTHETTNRHTVFLVNATGEPALVAPDEAVAIGVCDANMQVHVLTALPGFDPQPYTFSRGAGEILARFWQMYAARPAFFHTLAACRLDPDQGTLTIGALRGDWPLQPMPAQHARLAVNRVYPAEELAQIRLGRIPQTMEDRWVIVYEAGRLSLHRSWTGFCIYRARFTPQAGGYALTDATVNRDPEQYTGQDAADDARRLLQLIDALLLQRSSPVPAHPADAPPVGRRPAAGPDPALPGVDGPPPATHPADLSTAVPPALVPLDHLTIFYQGQPRTIAIYHGDLTAMPPDAAVDVLVVSALPDNYRPTPVSLIGALDRKGISVAALAQQKTEDLRPTLACWLSQPITTTDPGIQFQRILCFEPKQKGAPPEVIGDIFQCLISVVESGVPIRSVAMPLLAGGIQGVATAELVLPLVEAATHWLQIGLPVEQLNIVAYSAQSAAELMGAFGVLKRQYERAHPARPARYQYDLFISYSWQNKAEVDILVAELQRLRPGLRLFLDRHILKPGCAWQEDIFAALDDCHKVVAVYSPDYLASKVCREEFNIALYRQRTEGSAVLLPIYLYTATTLPTYMKLIQYMDCREGDPAALHQACRQILAKLAE